MKERTFESLVATQDNKYFEFNLTQDQLDDLYDLVPQLEEGETIVMTVQDKYGEEHVIDVRDIWHTFDQRIAIFHN